MLWTIYHNKLLHACIVMSDQTVASFHLQIFCLEICHELYRLLIPVRVWHEEIVVNVIVNTVIYGKKATLVYSILKVHSSLLSWMCVCVHLMIIYYGDNAPPITSYDAV